MADVTATLSAHWFWLILSVIFAIAEIIVPGFFLMWVAGAAALVGVIVWLVPIGIPAQTVLFAVLSVATVYAARRWFARHPIESEDPLLNNRTARMIGEIVTVSEAITGGAGRVRIGDSDWQARGPDAAIGARVRIISVSGGIVAIATL